MENNSNTVGGRIEHAMVQSSLNRGDLAKAMGVSYNSIGRWINENTIPKNAIAQARFEKATGFSIKWIETGEGDMRIHKEEPPYDPLQGYDTSKYDPNAYDGDPNAPVVEVEEDGTIKHTVKTSEYVDDRSGKLITTYVVTVIRDGR